MWIVNIEVNVFCYLGHPCGTYEYSMSWDMLGSQWMLMNERWVKILLCSRQVIKILKLSN